MSEVNRIAGYSEVEKKRVEIGRVDDTIALTEDRSTKPNIGTRSEVGRKARLVECRENLKSSC